MSIRKAGKRLVNLLLGLLTVLLICLALPGIAGIQCYAVVSGSMEPVLPVGSAVYVQKRAPKSIKEGEIITFLTNPSGSKVTHRIVKRNLKEKSFVTKGDANNQEDGAHVRWENVCGVAVGCIPYAGYVLEFFNNWKGKTAVLFLAIVLFLCSEILEPF